MNKKKRPNDYNAILPIRINRHIIRQKNHATNDKVIEKHLIKYVITRQYQKILLEYLMQGQYEWKEERPYDYCIILLIRINRCKKDMKKDERPYDYCIILLIRITPCKNDMKKDDRPYDYDIIFLIRITRCRKE